MAYTTFDEGYSRTTARVHGLELPRLLSEISRATKEWIGPSGSRRALKGKGTKADLEPGSGLAAISSYTRFIAAHPDMPRAHRDRFLGDIIRCCEELRAT